MSVNDKFISIYAEMENSENETIRDKADIFTFIIGLLPVLGVQQAGQIANKIITEKKLNERNEKLTNDLYSTNTKIEVIESEIERIGEMGKTVAMVTSLQQQVDELVRMLGESLNQDSSEFVVDTSNYSSQTILNQMINVDWAAISAVHHSHNELRNTRLRAKRTHMRAHDHSSNLIDGTDFLGSGDTIRMNEIVQKGIAEVSDGHLGLGHDGEIGFSEKSLLAWGPPETVSATCPAYGNLITVERRNVVGRLYFECPQCKAAFPANLK